MIAYKFLRSGRIGPFSEFQWPEPGTWVRPGSAAPCVRGIHACGVRDLPWWMGEELWQVELEGDVRRFEHKLVASGGRLLSQVQEWTPECARECAEACAWRVRGHAVQALSRSGLGDAAAALVQCATLEQLLATARELVHEPPLGRVMLTIAGDGAVRALAGAAPVSAYIAAHAALRAGGPEAYDAERAWQSRWLVERLGLIAEGGYE